MVLFLRLKSKGNRLGPGLLSQSNKYTNNASKMLEQLNALVSKVPYHKVMVRVDQEGDNLKYTLMYPGDAQVLRRMATPEPGRLNQVRHGYGLAPLSLSTYEGVLRSLR